MAPKDSKVPTLTDAADWPLWRLRVTDALNRDDLTSVVTGSEKSPPPEIAVTPPTPTTSSPPSTSPGAPATTTTSTGSGSSSTTHQVARRETWSWRNARALSTIREHLSNDIALELHEYQHASELWEKLVEKFKQTNTSEMAVTELIKIFRAKLADGDDGDVSREAMSAHIHRVRQSVTQLATLGYPLNANLVPLILLTSLPSSEKWKIVSSGISAGSSKAAPLTLSYVEAKLMAQVTSKEDSDDEQAYAASSSRAPPPRKPKDKGKKKAKAKASCVIHGEGHSTEECKTIIGQKEKVQKKRKERAAEKAKANKVKDSDLDLDSDSDSDVDNTHGSGAVMRPARGCRGAGMSRARAPGRVGDAPRAVAAAAVHRSKRKISYIQ
uniref:Uncharacterized protein n=1 Tax=Schizophyllum commune (strain H4-8 / FGSC 9210) TaxID=578458 RepID=D8PM88_SCHCM